jgi:hypothetical protein
VAHGGKIAAHANREKGTSIREVCHRYDFILSQKKASPKTLRLSLGKLVDNCDYIARLVIAA